MVAISPFLKHGWFLRTRNIVSWLGLALIIMACPPFDWIVYAAFGASFLFWFIVWNRAAETGIWLRMRTLAMVLMLFLLITLPAVEWSHRATPVIEGEASDHLVVLGDSISAGLGSRVKPWPTVMQQITNLNVRNISRAGATISDGMAMTESVSADDHLVLVELGGNDLLAGEPSDEFARGLEAVLAKLAVRGRTVVMFELPLLPGSIAYGRIQRRLAAKYGIWLIPKRFLTRIIAGPDATSDGLHLTDIGDGEWKR